MAQQKQIDVYMVTGFLESGKTTFMKKFVLPEEVGKKVKFALITFEEGEEEYDENSLKQRNIELFHLGKEQLDEIYLTNLQEKGNYNAIFVEYNGMYQFQDFINNMPESWAVVQVFVVMNAKTILLENSNMRSLVYDKLQYSDIAIFNRVSTMTNIEPLHKLVRAVSRQTTILLQDEKTMRVQEDATVDTLPYDMNAPVVTIEDRDYAYFYRDLCENTNSYEGKTLKFKALVGYNNAEKDKIIYIAGRRIMQCCAADIQFYGLACTNTSNSSPEQNTWYDLMGTIDVRYHSLYKKKGPVLNIISATKTEPLTGDNEVATFY